jgi:hypothetical protein
MPAPELTECRTVRSVLLDGSVEEKELCQLGLYRGLLFSGYIIVGVPLFAFTLGQISGTIK